MADVIVYRTYPFSSKGYDPVIDELNEVIDKENLQKKVAAVSQLTGLSKTTVYNLKDRKTRYPRYSTAMAIFSALGYYPEFKRTGRFDLESELHDAKRWALRRDAARLAKARKSKNGNKNTGATL